MSEKGSGRAVLGVLLIFLGLFALLVRFVPGLDELVSLELTWPLIVVAVGVALLIIGLVTGVPGMAVPACIVGGIGCILFWQNAIGNWQSWAYTWALIPGFGGVGTVLAGLLSRNREMVSKGIKTAGTSLVFFMIFAAAFGALGFRFPGSYWPVLLILAGLVFLVRALVQPRR